MGNALAVVSAKDAGQKPKGRKRELLNPLNESRTEELVFAVVGYAGSGTSNVAEMLARVFKKRGYEPHPIKARPILERAAPRLDIPPKEGTSPVGRMIYFQSVGDALRDTSGEHGCRRRLNIDPPC